MGRFKSRKSSEEKMSVKAVGLKKTCPHCGEEVELVLSKKQVKALFKGFKNQTIVAADKSVEETLGLDDRGNLKF